MSWRGHLLLTLALVVGAGAGMGIALAGSGPNANIDHGFMLDARNILEEEGEVGGWKSANWRAACVGVGLWGLGTAVGMGVCSWWLIGLQKYKNVVIGPWDPARPIIRQGGGWE